MRMHSDYTMMTLTADGAYLDLHAQIDASNHNARQAVMTVMPTLAECSSQA